jgi:hypothetical protein
LVELADHAAHHSRMLLDDVLPSLVSKLVYLYVLVVEVLVNLFPSILELADCVLVRLVLGFEDVV